MIDTQAIRKKILYLALQGKLTEQLPGDGTADELYQQIQQEKHELGKIGKIKKGKAFPLISKEEKPFDIPYSWKWVKLGDVIALVSGTDFKPEDYNDAGIGIPYMTGASNIENDKLIINRWTPCPRNIAHKGELLLVCKGSGFGKLVICNVPQVHIARQFMSICPYDGVDVNYVKAVMTNSLQLIKEAGKGLIPGVDRDTVLNIPLPLPPLAEQKRIVDKIESAFSILNTIDTLQSQYQINLSTLKSKMIDAAIQGKLTEQLPEDGTGEELFQQIQQEKAAMEKAGKIKKSNTLPPVTEEEKSFEVPRNWKWVRFDTIANIMGTGMIRAGNEQYNEAEYYYFKMNNIGNFDGKCHFENMVMVNATKEEVDKYKLEEGDFLFNTRNSKELVGKTAVVPYISQPIIFNNNILKIHFLGGLDPKYINYYFLSTQGREKLSGFVTSTTNVAAIYQRQLITISVPLPPIAEQKRIVTKLEEILPLCE